LLADYNVIAENICKYTDTTSTIPLSSQEIESKHLYIGENDFVNAFTVLQSVSKPDDVKVIKVSYVS